MRSGAERNVTTRASEGLTPAAARVVFRIEPWTREGRTARSAAFAGARKGGRDPETEEYRLAFFLKRDILNTNTDFGMRADGRGQYGVCGDGPTRILRFGKHTLPTPDNGGGRTCVIRKSFMTGTGWSLRNRPFTSTTKNAGAADICPYGIIKTSSETH